MLAKKVLNALNEALAEGGGFDDEKPLLLAVSGGVDSLSLTHALHGSDFKLIVAHLDHALRPSSALQAETLGKMMAAWGLPFVSKREDVGRFAKANKLGIEEAARICRYQFLFDVAVKCEAQAIVLGHNADDQVETVLMHFMRGTGMAGLTGMSPRTILAQYHTGIPLLRPLLGINREALEAYAIENDLTPLEDESNLIPLYYRNQLRLQLIPAMEALNPGFKVGVRRAVEVLRGDEQVLLKLEQEAYKNSLIQASEREIILSRQALLQNELGLQRRVIRRCLIQLCKINPDFGFQDIESARELIAQGRGAQDLSSGLKVILVGDELHLLKQGESPTILSFPQMSSAMVDHTLDDGETLELKNGWRLSARIIDAQAYAQMPEGTRQNPTHAFINPNALEMPLKVRAKKAGDRWSPLGLESGSQKLSDFLVNNKIPQATRALWPLVLSGGDIIWLSGLRISHAWRLRGDEREILYLSLHQKADDN